VFRNRSCRLTRTYNIFHLICLGLILTLAGCGPAEPTSGPEVTIESTRDSASILGDDAVANPQPYPAPSEDNVSGTEAYPVPSEVQPLDGPYPAPISEDAQILAFEGSIRAGDTIVRGFGPPGLSVSILNITLMGEFIGSGVVGTDGTFAVQVDPLQALIRIGLHADIENFGLSSDHIQPGAQAIRVPLACYFYDSLVISQ